MIKNRRLSDLYVKGKTITIGDDDDTVTVWMQKLNSSEHEAIIRKANAARAKLLAGSKDEESEEYQALCGEVMELEKDEMIDILIANELANKAQAIESEISEKEEWSKDNYVQGLRDAWLGGLSEEFHKERTEESVKVFEELKRFTDQVNAELDAARLDLQAAHLERNLDSIYKEAVEQRIVSAGNMEWLKTYRKGEVVYSVRDPEDHKIRLLDWNSDGGHDCIDDLQEEVLNRLMSEYRDMSVEPVEGKD